MKNSRPLKRSKNSISVSVSVFSPANLGLKERDRLRPRKSLKTRRFKKF